MTDRWLGVVVDNELQSGFIVFGLFAPAKTVDPEFPLQDWPDISGFSSHRLWGEGWSTVEWRIAITEAVAASLGREAMKPTMAALVRAGARVAWVGLEGGFCDPPSLFDAACMPGSVYAVLSPAGQFWSGVEVGERPVPMSDEAMLDLRRSLTGVADREGRY